MTAGLTRRAAVGGLLSAASVPTWGAVSERFAPSVMAADVALLRRAYETLHPGLLRYQTAATSAERFDALAVAVRQPLSPTAFYLLLSRYLATVRCGHSYANFYNQTEAVRQALFDDQPRLPLQFFWLGSRMMVTADPFATGIAPGSEVLAIDGRPAGEVLAALMPFARADGHNDAKRRRLLSVQGEDGYESFDIFHALTLGGGARYRLLVRGPDGRQRSAVVPAATLAQRRAQRGPLIDASGDTPQWTVERRGDVAVLTMPGWGLYNSKWDWRGWLDAEVDRLIADRVPRLIVDIRRNEGGEDCGDALVARLIERPVTASPARRLVRYRRLPDDLKPYCDTWDRRFDTLGVEARPYDGRYLELKGAEGATVIRPKGPRYTGKVAVLIGPQNSSATFQFAEMTARERLATLIGEPTGGNRRGINGGAFYFLRLPGTGIEADLPLIGTFPLTPQPDAGVIPDISVPLTAPAIADGSDPAMARALA